MAQTKQNTKAVIYARFSPRTKQEDCESCERQIEICRNYCTFYKLKVIGEFMDKAKSGGSVTDRFGLKEALHLAIQNRASLVVFSMSRLARNLGDLIEISNRLNHAKCGLCSTKEKIDTSSPQGDLFFKMMGLIDEFLRKSNAEYTSRMMLQHQLSGRRMSDRLPYGYKLDPKDPARLIVNDMEQEVIERVKQLHNEGMSLRGIAKQLSLDGYKPRKKKTRFKGQTVLVKGKWQHTLILKILSRVQVNAT